ncbi:pentatricopeptide repeat-containing protein At5g52850, chloroplastic-like [Wolffia australiana]
MLRISHRDVLFCSCFARDLRFFSSSLHSDGLRSLPTRHRRTSADKATMSATKQYPSLCGVNIYRNRLESHSHGVFSVIRSSGTQNLGSAAISEELCAKFLFECNKSRALKEGITFHSPLIKLNLLYNLTINNNLLSLYCKSGSLANARNLFDELFQRDVVSWTAMISAHAKSGREEDAIDIFEEMISTGSASPNEFTFSSVLSSCSSSSRTGLRSHAQIVKLGFQSNNVLLGALLNFYGKLGMIEETIKVFSEVEERDIVSWTIMISSLLDAGKWADAHKLFSSMAALKITPNEFTFSRLITASSNSSPRIGELVHSRVISSGVELTLVLKTALVDMYSKFGRMGDAQKAFDQSAETDPTLWTALISGYLQNSDFDQAIVKFREMGLTGVPPASFTYSSVLSACSSLPSPELGLQLHSRVIKSGSCSDASVGNALMDMYAKCFTGGITPELIFSEIDRPNVISWTVLINSLFHDHRLEEAESALTDMQLAGVRPNSFTITAVLNGTESLLHARKLHAYVIKSKLTFQQDFSVWNSLVDSYVRLGEACESWKVFNEMDRRDAISYTNLASGLNKLGFHGETLNLFFLLQDDELGMDCFLLPCFLSASAGLVAIEAGRQLHCQSMKSGLNLYTSVANGLIDMYGKCGVVGEAKAVFRSMNSPNVVSWNGLISGLACNGFFAEAISAYERFIVSGEKPDSVTFLLLLYACSHGGLADLGLDYFNSMREVHDVVPELDHFVCLVDLLGRAGRVEEAAAQIEKMPLKPDAMVYKTLLGACRLSRNLGLGEFAAARALELDSDDPAIYVLLSRLYEDVGKTKLGEEMRREMKSRGLKKDVGRSWVEIRNRIHQFTARDSSDPVIGSLHDVLDELEKKMASSSSSSSSSSRHSEKLALAFGLLHSPPGAPVRVIKNLRICIDCHAFMELASRVTSREIIIRDGNRYHTFKDGVCSCGGFW